MRRGLVEVVPERALKLCTWEELEVLVCGDPRIDVAVMKANTTYHGYSVRVRVRVLVPCARALGEQRPCLGYVPGKCRPWLLRPP